MWPNQQFMADLITFTVEILMEKFMFCAVEKSDLCELCQQEKQLKAMEMNEVWLDICYKEYMHYYQPESCSFTVVLLLSGN